MDRANQNYDYDSKTVDGINRIAPRSGPDLHVAIGVTPLIVRRNILTADGRGPGVSFQIMVFQISVPGRHRVTLPTAGIGIDDGDVTG